MREIFIARQPIFDARHRIKAYELLYRDGPEAVSAGDAGASTMTSTVIVNGVLNMGLRQLTGGQTAFVNISERLLLSGVHEVLNPSRVVIELLETVRPTPEVLAACTRLKESGFRLAVDDFVYTPEAHPLLVLADVVKVDVLQSWHEMDTLVERLRPFDVQLLAEKVETADEHRRCLELGFELFQGFHYFRPETLTRRDLTTESAAIARLLGLLGDLTVTDREIEEVFRSDPSLSFKLLRLVNAAALGGRGVDSIGHAMRLLGREPLYRWLSLLLLAVGNGGGEIRMEMIRSSLERGRMCELVGDVLAKGGSGDAPGADALFLVGLFSLLDVLLGVEMKKILADIRVTREVREALLGFKGKTGRVLRSVVAYADGHWDEAAESLSGLGVDPAILPDVYLDALSWASHHMIFHAHG